MKRKIKLIIFKICSFVPIFLFSFFVLSANTKADYPATVVQYSCPSGGTTYGSGSVCYVYSECSANANLDCGASFGCNSIPGSGCTIDSYNSVGDGSNCNSYHIADVFFDRVCNMSSYGWGPVSPNSSYLGIDNTSVSSSTYNATPIYGCTQGGKLSGKTCLTPVNGTCGSANGQLFLNDPTPAQACSSGTFSGYTNQYPWVWSCIGSNGGTTSGCSAGVALGTCGSDNGKDLYSTPVNFCSQGKPFSLTTTSTGWYWTCNGQPCTANKMYSCTRCSNVNSYAKSTFDTYSSVCDSNANPTPTASNNLTYTLDCSCGAKTSDPFGFTNSCVVIPPTNGTCGSSNGQSFATKPATNLCSSGNPTSVSGAGPWSWSCVGTNGGSTSSCQANLAAGSCGSDNGQNLYSVPTNLCASGSSLNFTPTSTGWTWTCNGTSCSANKLTDCGPSCSSVYSYTSASYQSIDNCLTALNGIYNYSLNCSCGGKLSDPFGYTAMCATPINGQCGSSNGKTFASQPMTGLCASGSSYQFTTTSTGWIWKCLGANGGTDANNCFAKKPDPAADGVCGSSNGQSLASQPTTNLCSVGSASSVSTVGSQWQWTCSGVNGGNSVNCSAQNNTSGWSEVAP